jgi:hypothetical protein
LGQALIADAQERTLAGAEASAAATARKLAIQHEGLPAQDLGKELGGAGSVGFRSSGVSAAIVLAAIAGLRVVGREVVERARALAGFVRAQLGFDVRGLRVAPTSSPTPGSALGSPLPGSGLIPYPLANPFGFRDQIVEEVTHVAGHAVDHREDFFEHVSNEIRGRDAQLVGELADVLRQLLGDSRVQDAFLAIMVALVALVATAAMGRMAGGRVVSRHESHCDSS